MIVEKEILMRVMLENQSKKMTFRFYGIYATSFGSDLTDLMDYESIIPENTTSATYEHRPDIQIDALPLIHEEWENIAYFTLDGKTICKRSEYGQPMISRDDELFTQPPYEQMVEDEIIAQKTGRTIINSELTESDAGSLMAGFAAYRKKFKEENNL
jgi:hypothetical protein